MAGTPAAEPFFQKRWLTEFRYHCADRYVRTPDTYRHSISVLSNSNSVRCTSHVPFKFSECKKHAQNNGYLLRLCPCEFYSNPHL